MAVKRSSRVKLNRKAVDGAMLAVADGILALGQTIVETADPPDAEPFGEGLVTTGGVLVYIGDKKVGGWGQDGRQPKKPRMLRVRGASGITAAVGFGFPGRFQEFGTAHHPAQPFFVPAVDQVVPRAVSIVRQASAYRIKRLRG